MPKHQKPQKPHEFTKASEFDEAMKKLVNVPKEEVERREREEKGRREQKK